MPPAPDQPSRPPSAGRALGVAPDPAGGPIPVAVAVPLDEASPAVSTLPVAVALDALDAWLRDPTLERRARLERSLAALVRASRARGARLEVTAPPLPAIAIGDGSLSEWEPPESSDADASTGSPGQLLRYDLSAGEGGASLGRLWLDRPDPQAAYAVRALELALDAGWSRARIGETVERLSALDAATRAIASVLSLDRVLQLIVDTVRELSDARYAALGLFDERGLIERFLTSGMSAAERDRIGAPPRGLGLLGALLREGGSVRIPDVAADPRSVGFPPGHPAMRSFLGVPIHVKGQSVGNLYLTEKSGAAEFTQSDQELVETFATHAGIAIENARLHERVQRLAIVEERERIGRDLHDGIIQRLYAVGLSLEDVPELMDESPPEAAARVDRAIESLNDAIRDIRNFIFGLRPELLEQADLPAALAGLAEEFRLNTMIDIDLVVVEEAERDLPTDDRLQILQIARESLSNIARHADATRAAVRLAIEGDGSLRLEIADNGRGFDPAFVRGPSHQGLANIRGRTAALGGAVAIESEPGAGTRIIVRLPPRDEAQAIG